MLLPIGASAADSGLSCCEPRNRAVADVVAAGDLAYRLAIAGAPADCLALLAFGGFRFAAQLTARAVARSRPSLVRARIKSLSNSARPPRRPAKGPRWSPHLDGKNFARVNIWYPSVSRRGTQVA